MAKQVRRDRSIAKADRDLKEARAELARRQRQVDQGRGERGEARGTTSRTGAPAAASAKAARTKAAPAAKAAAARPRPRRPARRPATPRAKASSPSEAVERHHPAAATTGPRRRREARRRQAAPAKAATTSAGTAKAAAAKKAAPAKKAPGQEAPNVARPGRRDVRRRARAAGGRPDPAPAAPARPTADDPFRPAGQRVRALDRPALRARRLPGDRGIGRRRLELRPPVRGGRGRPPARAAARRIRVPRPRRRRRRARPPRSPEARRARLDPDPVRRDRPRPGRGHDHVRRDRAAASGERRPSALREIERASGVPLHVLSHEEEGYLTLIGVTHGREPAADLAVVDVGGGSSEFIVVGPGRDAVATGVRIGSARLTAAHVAHDPPTVDEITALRAAARERLIGAPDTAIRQLVAVGGTATNLLKVVPAAALDRTLTRARLARAMVILATEPAAFAAIHHAVNPIRARVLPAGVAIMEAILERYGLDRVTVVDTGSVRARSWPPRTPARHWRDRAAADRPRLAARRPDGGAASERRERPSRGRAGTRRRRRPPGRPDRAPQPGDLALAIDEVAPDRRASRPPTGARRARRGRPGPSRRRRPRRASARGGPGARRPGR